MIRALEHSLTIRVECECRMNDTWDCGRDKELPGWSHCHCKCHQAVHIEGLNTNQAGEFGECNSPVHTYREAKELCVRKFAYQLKVVFNRIKGKVDYCN